MPLSNTRELKEDVLFRASESLVGSAWDSKVIDYLNRVYRTLAAGASEFLPEYVDDWWWMRDTGTLILAPCYTSGTISITNGLTQAVLSAPPDYSLEGYRLRVIGHPDVFVIASHLASDVNVLLDFPYTGDTDSAANFQLMKTEYELDASVQVLSSPMTAFRNPHRINGLTPEKMDELFPVITLSPGVPQAFCLESDTTVRFSHGGREDGASMRVEYRFRPEIEDLVDSTGSIPRVPPQWMHLLADMALVYVLLDKNDDRSNAAALGARTGLAAMLKENRRRLTKIDQLSGQIVTRPGSLGTIAPGPRMGRI